MVTTERETSVAKKECPRLHAGIAIQPFQSGTTEQLYLVTMPDGRRLQVSSAFYQILQLMDGQHSWSDIALNLAGPNNPSVNGSSLKQLVEEKFESTGLLESQVDSSVRTAPVGYTGLSPLQLLVKVPLLSYEQLAGVVHPLRYLFAPPFARSALVLVVLVQVWVLTQHVNVIGTVSLIRLTTDLNMFAGVLGLLFLSGVIHEFGHLAACHRYNCRHSKLGLGLYYSSIVFYVDVTDAWRLPRGQRVVIDLGGLYFQVLVSMIYGLIYLFTNRSEWLLAILAIDLSLVSNLNPMLKFDGYWALSDALGLANLHQRVGDYFGQLLGGKHYTQNQIFLQVNRTTRFILGAYALSFVVYFSVFLWAMFAYVPQFITTYPSVANQALVTIQEGWAQGLTVHVLAGLWQLIGPTLFIIVIIVLLRRLILSVWRLEPIIRAIAVRSRRRPVS